MLDKGKISNLHIEFVMIPTILATGALSVPSIAGKLARHDIWMTPFIGSLLGFITVYISWKLHQLYPRLTPIQYSEKILEKHIGMLVNLLFVFFYVHATGLIIRQYSLFITGNVMLETPSVVFSICIIFVSALAVRGGIEVIARSAVICTTIYLSTSVVLLFLIKDIDIGYLLPILEDGLVPVIKGGFIHGSWFSEFFLLAFLLPYIKNQGKSLKSGMRASLFVLLIFLYVNFFVLTILGVSSINQFYPVYSIVRGISVLNFFENFEVLITGSWVLGNFVKVSLFLYVASLSIAQFLRLTDYKLIVFPLCLLMVLVSYWDIPTIVTLVEFMATIQPFYIVIFQTVLPLFLLSVALARRQRSENS